MGRTLAPSDNCDAQGEAGGALGRASAPTRLTGMAVGREKPRKEPAARSMGGLCDRAAGRNGPLGSRYAARTVSKTVCLDLEAAFPAATSRLWLIDSARRERRTGHLREQQHHVAANELRDAT